MKAMSLAKKNPQKLEKRHGPALTLSAVPAACPSPHTWSHISSAAWGLWGHQLSSASPGLKGELGCPSLPQGCWSPSGSQGAAQSPPWAKRNRADCSPPALGASLPQHSQSPLPSLPAGAGTPEQKKIMIIICCVILGIVIASTFGGIFG